MTEQTKIEHSVSLNVASELERGMARVWFQSVRDNLGSGIVTTIQVDGKPVQMVKFKDNDGVRYSIPLLRDATSDEITAIINDFTHACDSEFKVSATTSDHGIEIKTDIEVDHEPLLNLCTKWAKAKHDDWRKNKEDSGWRYGPTVSKTNRTHPLLRAWEEIPAEYRKVDTSAAQELLDLLKDSGYVLIRSDDLNNLLGD